MALPADVLAATAKANAALAQTAKARLVAAEYAELTRKQHDHDAAILRGLDRVQEALEVAEKVLPPGPEIAGPAFELLAETQKIWQMVLENRKQTRQQIKLAQLTLIRVRRSGGSRSSCPGGRARASRGRPVRRRGSRRTTGTRAGPDPDRSQPASRYALAGGPV